MHAFRRLAIILITTLLALYLGLCLFLFFVQRRFVYFPQADVSVTPADYSGQYDEFWIPTAASGRLQAWWIPAPSQPAPTLLYFHGNGANIGANAAQAVRLSRIGCNVLIFDYRGYGRSSGPFPSEQRVYQDAEAAWQYLVQQKRVPPRDIILYGHSMGGAVAIEMSTRHPDAVALIVESTLTSVVDRAAMDPVYRIFPIHLLTTDRFDSIHKIDRIHLPVLIVHGDSDVVIPISMAYRLYGAANEPKRLLVVPGAGHENVALIAGEQYQRTLRDFVAAVHPSL